MKFEKDHDFEKESRRVSGNNCFNSISNVACTDIQN
jgi:hypothetical protein